MSRRMPIFSPDVELNMFDWVECDTLEFKSAQGGVPQDLWPSYSALANAQGGVICLGVNDDGSICGVRDVAALRKSFWDTVNNRQKTSVNILSAEDVQDVKVAGGRTTFIAIRVPPANRRQKPVFINNDMLSQTYRRTDTGDYRCNEAEVRQMVSDSLEQTADERILRNFTMADLDELSLRQYRQRLRSFRPDHVWLNEDDKGLLTKLGGWRCERNSGDEGLTVAGLLMFGNDDGLRDAKSEGLSRYYVDYREKMSDDPAERWSDRVVPDGTWSGNLFQFYIRVSQKLTADLKVPFRMENLVRIDDTPVHQAVREALVNALIHADYFGVGGVVIEKNPLGFRLSNPGSLLVSHEQLYRGGSSECRNKNLQTMFMLIGNAEKAGSGVDKILQAWRGQHWQLPTVHETQHPARVQWSLPVVSLLSDEVLQRLRSLFGAEFETFCKDDVVVLACATERAMDNKLARELTGLHRADATALLQKLVKKNALIQFKKTSAAYYELPTRGSVPNVGSKTPNIGSKTPNVGGKTPNVGGNWSQIDADIQNILLRIAAPAQTSKHLKKQTMEQIILELCAKANLSKREIAELVKREPESLLANYLNPMLNKGLLRRVYPDIPNHISQKYITVELQQIVAPPMLLDEEEA